MNETLDLKHTEIKPLYWSGINVITQQIRVNSFIEDLYWSVWIEFIVRGYEYELN